MKISIAYCITCNYAPIAAALAMAIKIGVRLDPKLVPSPEIGAFEVEVDGELIFSKIRTGRFPEHSEILDIVRGKERQ